MGAYVTELGDVVHGDQATLLADIPGARRLHKSLEEVAKMTDEKAIAKEYASQERRFYAPSSSRIIYRETVDRNEAHDDASSLKASETMVGKAEEYLSALRDYCKANGIKAHLAETVVALSACTRKPGCKYPYSMQELGGVLNCSHQSAQVRYETYLTHEAAVKQIAETVLVAH
jgi:hypothetical protein